MKNGISMDTKNINKIIIKLRSVSPNITKHTKDAIIPGIRTISMFLNIRGTDQNPNTVMTKGRVTREVIKRKTNLRRTMIVVTAMTISRVTREVIKKKTNLQRIMTVVTAMTSAIILNLTATRQIIPSKTYRLPQMQTVIKIKIRTTQTRKKTPVPNG